MNTNDIALTLEYGLGAKTIAKLLEIFGTADEIYAAPPSDLVRRGGLSEPLAAQIARKEYHRQAEKEQKYLAKHGITAIASTDDGYPPLMREMNDYPHVLYVRGNVEALQARCLSMVGTRRISQYGQTMCDRLVRELAARAPELCIVSGLAFGVDVNCHRAALRYGLPTVAVVANALPGVTPAQHSDIACDIVEKGGAIVSELHSNSKQTGDFYIARNRLIAGLSEGTVIVEADTESGSLHTARFALDYDRQVMAVAGRATDSVAKGCNNLIKNNTAQMVCSGEDIIRTMLWDFNAPEIGEKPRKNSADIPDEARRLLEYFESGNTVSIDRLGEVSGLGHGQLAAALMSLETAEMIRRLPGGLYEIES